MIVQAIRPPAQGSRRLSEPIKYWMKKKRREDCIIAHHSISTGLDAIIAFFSHHQSAYVSDGGNHRGNGVRGTLGANL